jgi:hypothetical protein
MVIRKGAPMTDLTPQDADEALERYGPDDLAFAVAYAATHPVDAVWRAALDRAKVAEGGGGRKSRDHRRGRRG